MDATFAGVPGVGEFQAAFGAWLDEHASALEGYRGFDAGPVETTWSRDTHLIRLLHEAGWNRWGWSVEVGGLGGGADLRAAMYEQLSAHGYVVAEVMNLMETLAPALVHFAPAIAAEFLPRFLRGEETWCQGFSEPEAGSDLASLRLRAVDAGDHWVVNGQKIWTSLAHLAKRCALLTRTGDAASAHRGLTMLFLDMETPGVNVRPIMNMGGREGFAEVFFDDVAVPKDRVVGEIDGGWQAAMYLLQWERGMYAWMRQAVLHTRLEQSLEGVTIDGSLATRMGEVYEILFALRSRCGETVRRLALGQTPGPEISVDKVLLATAEQAVFDVAREIRFPELELGVDDHADAWREEFLASRAASIYGGAIEIQRTILAERMLGLPREPAGGR